MRVLVHGGRVVDPSQGLDGAFDLLLEDGRVAKLGERVEAPEGTRMVDAAGTVVAPGLIDIHVHLREPGQEYKETVRTGTMAAAAGGFTAVACMANTEPVNDNRSVTGHILAEAELHGFARVYPIGAITKGLAGQELAEIGELIAAGAVAVSDDGHPVRNSAMMRRALEYAQHFSAVVIQHAQDMDLTAGGVMHEGEWSTRLGLPGIPGLAEDLMVARDLLLLEVTGGRYHVAHLSTARSLELVRDAKRRGLAATCEVTPHHLLLTDHAVAEREFSTDTKMNPPLRPEGDREALLQGLTDGTVDCIASDHAPHHADEKALQFELAPFGIVGLETTLPLCLDRLVRPGILSLSRLIELLSCGPARVLGIPGGTLREGSPADVTLMDLEAPFSMHASEFRSKGRNTPFEGWSGLGRARLTIVGGRVVELPGRDG